ncbi:hypothetical protein MNAN1_003483 [Malassezia nana]|uniref:Uncharacterized protein n=1 Tax=Malassezia nana TaxID=180528 RepID=A0AAF0EU37_9BASI|nr:hypothetical protein MNAN1_003483 [Malassezia nana]
MRKSAVILACVAAAVNAKTVEYDWTIGYIPQVNPDGLQPRRAIGINGQFPPPIVNVNSDDTVRIHFHNRFGDGTGSTLHAHGMFFNRTNFMDGAAMLTQCPVPDGESFVYETLNSPSSPPDRQPQWGTYWMHGHYGGQYVDGFRLPNIIHNAQGEVHAYDDDYTLVLADWYHREHNDLLYKEFMNPKNPGGAEPVPDAPLVYLAHTPANGTAEYLPGFNDQITLPFEPGKTYRLRMINMAALSMFHVWLEGHDMEIIEADGVDMEPLPVDSVSLSVAQRYSVLVRARNDTDRDWTLHANMDPDMFDDVPDTLQLNVSAKVTYGTPHAPLGVGRATIDTYDAFNDTQLQPIMPMAPLQPIVSQDLNVVFTTYKDGINYASFNNITYVGPLTPSLLTMKTETAPLAMNPLLYGPSSGAYVAPFQTVVEFVIYNWDAGSHPFHMHGTQFQVVHKSNDVMSSDPADNPPFIEGENPNPVRRDTVVVPAGGSARLRFVADNPGAWFMHCHIDWHLSSGLAMIVLVAPDQVAQSMDVPDVIAQQCRQLGFSTSGNAGGIRHSITSFGALPAPPRPLVTGWTGTMIGTFIACIISALIGLATLCWYGWSTGPDDDEQDTRTP